VRRWERENGECRQLDQLHRVGGVVRWSVWICCRSRAVLLAPPGAVQPAHRQVKRSSSSDSSQHRSIQARSESTRTFAEPHPRDDESLFRAIGTDLGAGAGKGDSDILDHFGSGEELFDGRRVLEEVPVRVPEGHLQQLGS